MAKKKRAAPKAKPAPEPVTDGLLRVTMPSGLHRRAAMCAALDGVALEDWIVCALAYHVGRYQAMAETEMAATEPPRG